MIEVSSAVRIYEKNDKELHFDEERRMIVFSHWNNRDRVVIELGGERYTVVASDLIAAIANAQNTNK